MVSEELDLRALDLTTLVRMDLPLPMLLRPEPALDDDALMSVSRALRPFRLERTRAGEIEIMSPNGMLSGQHEQMLLVALVEWNRHAGRGVTIPANVGVNLPDGSCLAADAAWMSHERYSSLTREQKQGFLPFCPEFIVEIRLQSDRRRKLEAKMELWVANGAKLAWLIDLQERSVSVYRPGEETESLEAPEMVAGTGPLEGFLLNAGAFWSVGDDER